MNDVQPVRGRLLTTREACTFLGMPQSRLRRLVASKKIPVIRDGRLGFYERDLEEWIAAHRSPASGSARVAVPAPSRQRLRTDDGIDGLLRDIKRRGGSPFDYTSADDAPPLPGAAKRRGEAVHA